MKDIETRADIELLVDRFYESVINDQLIGYFFIDIANLNWDIHIPLMCNFWESIILGKANYK